MNFYRSARPPPRFALVSASRFREPERNTGDALNSRVSKRALKFLAVKLAASRGNSRAVNSPPRPKESAREGGEGWKDVEVLSGI